MNINIERKGNSQSDRKAYLRKRRKNNQLLKIVLLILGLLLVWVIFFLANIISKDKETKYNKKNEDMGVESVTIETPYTKLEFPKEWTDKIRIETIESDIYTLKFYGNIEEKGELELLDLSFGNADGYTLGYLKIENGNESIPVNLNYYNTELDNTWNPEQETQVQKMHSVVENVIDRLLEKEEFEIVQ